MNLTTDYLIVGSGAMGMAFADTLLAESDADMVIVDRHAKPGGHWNVAYPFVHLHQPSSFFGVSHHQWHHRMQTWDTLKPQLVQSISKLCDAVSNVL